jgi:hypothetical protein
LHLIQVPVIVPMNYASIRVDSSGDQVDELAFQSNVRKGG